MSVDKVSKHDILILSADFGTGHHQVSLAIEKMINMEEPSFNVGIVNFFKCIYPLFDKAIKLGYSAMIKHFSWCYDWFYRTTQDVDPDSRWQRILDRIGRRRLINLIEETSPKVIVCTFPTPAGVVSRLKAEGIIDTPLVVVVTDVAVHSQWIHSEVDAYLVASDTIPPKMVRRGVTAEKIYVTGIPIRPQFEAFPLGHKPWTPINPKGTPFKLLIMGGGEGLMPGVEEVCKGLGELGLPIEITALTGRNESLAKSLKVLAGSSPIPIHVLSYVEDIAPIMRDSHLLLSKAGGITVFEALATGLPILIYKPLPGHEMCNVDFLMDKRAALLAWDAPTAIEIIKNVVENPYILKNMKKAILPLAKPASARDSVSIILDLAHYEISQRIMEREIPSVRRAFVRGGLTEKSLGNNRSDSTKEKDKSVYV